ncbi:MAG: hypothetical protein AB1633_09245, partial [Elusimicrobiota bacterium]
MIFLILLIGCSVISFANASYIRSLAVDDKYVWINLFDSGVKRLIKECGNLKKMPFKGLLLHS